MKKYFFIICYFIVSISLFSQTTWKSAKYNYTITQPAGYNVSSATGMNIDLKLLRNDGSLILVNVTPRSTSEYYIDAHSYSKSSLSKGIPAITITTFEKSYVDNQKVIIYQFTEQGDKGIEMMAFVGNHVYLLTATSITDFSNQLPVFIKTFKSIRFNE